MKRANQILVQLREADKYANSKSPHFRRFAVILLDNLIELQLSRRAEVEFWSDRTTWMKGVRKHPRTRRRNVDRDHAELLKFAQEQGWISEGDLSLLKYCHRVRNGFYHDGDSDTLDAELVIRLLYRFIDEAFPAWGARARAVNLSPYKPISIDEAADDNTGFCPLLVGCEDESDNIFGHSNLLHSIEYWKNALKQVLTYRPTTNICELIQKRVIKYLDEVERRVDFITNDSDGMNLCDVLIHRFAIFSDMFVDLWSQGKNFSLNGALNVYLAVLREDHEEKLLDIPDQAQRTIKFHELLSAHAFVPDPFPQKLIRDYRVRAENLLRGTESDGIALFLEMQESMKLIGPALQAFATDLDCYIERLTDEMRGK